jgi:hypothetical protein
MTCRPFPADQLMQVFIFAYVMKHIPALIWFSGVLIHASSRNKKLFKRLAEEVSVFAIADRGKSELLVPISPMVRRSDIGRINSVPAKVSAVPRGASSLRGKFLVQPVTAVVAPPNLSTHKPAGNCASRNDDRM